MPTSERPRADTGLDPGTHPFHQENANCFPLGLAFSGASSSARVGNSSAGGGSRVTPASRWLSRGHPARGIRGGMPRSQPPGRRRYTPAASTRVDLPWLHVGGCQHGGSYCAPMSYVAQSVGWQRAMLPQVNMGLPEKLTARRAGGERRHKSLPTQMLRARWKCRACAEARHRICCPSQRTGEFRGLCPAQLGLATVQLQARSSPSSE